MAVIALDQYKMPVAAATAKSVVTMLVVVTVVMNIMQEAAVVVADVTLTNASDRPATLSVSSVEPSEGQVLEPGQRVALKPGAHLLHNIRTVNALMEVDNALYSIQDAPLDAGYLILYEVVAGEGTVGPIRDIVPITGEW